jgi:hypothetical protein
VASGVIRLTRAPGGYRDSLRSYTVWLDGQLVGKIRRGKTLAFSVVPGEHGLQLTVDWCSSRLQVVRLADAQTADFYCKPAGAFYEIWRLIVNVNEYIELVPLPSPRLSDSGADDPDRPEVR